MPSTKDRVDNLERVLAEYIKNIGNAQMQTEREIREFKEEVKEFKDEMKEFKDEMKEFKDEMREDRRNMNKKWGEIANKMGTVVEDIVAPNIPRIAQEYFQCEDAEFFGLRVTKRNSKDKSRSREFDIIAVYDDKILINETKSSPRIDYINEFIEVLKEVYDYFPEYKGKRIIPIFSSLYIPENVVTYLMKVKVYAMAMRDDVMELLNPRI
ncbi:MAG: ELKS/Rab6-interacting/CAST family protein [Candidatus Jettenia sp.]|nr:ELKS/Rab6-interacting/CAST family protein [Candidatus Jettenia sp.]